MAGLKSSTGGSLDIGGNRKLQVENLERVQNFSTILGNRVFFSGTADDKSSRRWLADELPSSGCLDSHAQPVNCRPQDNNRPPSTSMVVPVTKSF